MIKFRDTYSDTSEFVSEPGTPYLDQYEYEINKKGVQQLVKTDKKKDVYGAIQADYDSTDINKLMAKFALGDTSAINVREGFYVDATKMPKNLAELFDRAQDCQEFFEKLPADFKELFNNSYTEFFSQLNSDEKSVYSIVDEYNDRFVNHEFDDGSVQPDPPAPQKGADVSE